MSVGLGTSVVLRVLVGEPVDLARTALLELTRRVAEGEAVFVSDLVVAETCHALQFHYGVPKVDALAMLRTFLGQSGVRCLGAAGDVLDTPGLATSNPGFVDRLIHAEHGREDVFLFPSLPFCPKIMRAVRCAGR